MKEDALRAAFEILGGAGGETWYPVSGTSMLPFFREGDMLRVAILPERGDVFAVGAVYVFHTGGQVLAHRLIRKSGRGLVFRGDNRVYFDPVIQPAEVIGQVTHLRRGSRVVELLSGRPALIGKLAAYWGAATGPVLQVLYGYRRRLWGTRPVPGMRWFRKARERAWRLLLRQ